MAVPKRYELGVITDEISQDFETALRVARDMGMRHVELGTLWDKQVSDLTEDELRAARALLDQYDLRVHVICGLLFRPFSLADVELAAMEEHPRFQEHLRLLERCIHVARTLDAPYIRTFGFTRDQGGTNPSPRFPDGGGITDETLAKIAKGIRIACNRVDKDDLTLVLENARSLYANTGGNMRRVLQAVDHPRLKVIWDPANAFVAGEQPLDGLAAVRGSIVDVHCKDAMVVDEASGLTNWVCIGDGGTDWLAQLRALQDEPVATLTVETHWHPPGQGAETDTRLVHAALQQVLEQMNHNG